MTINNILSFAVFSRLTSRNDDILADRIGHLYTVFIFIIFSIIVGVKQFVGEPIHCLVPPEYVKPGYNAYITSNCWIQNTYYVNSAEQIPTISEAKESKELVYYQWVPIIILFMAFLFKLPYILWRILCELTGFNVSVFVTLAAHGEYDPPDKHDEKVKQISDYLDRWLTFNRKILTIPPRGNREKARYLQFESSDRWFLLMLYWCIKVWYCANAITQFFLLNAFLGDWYSMYGSEIVQNLFKDEPVVNSIRFPIETMCDFKLRQLNNIHDFTIHCVLPINLFNEKIFMFIWFWLVFVSVMVTYSLLKWTVLILFREKRIRFINDYLQLLNLLCGQQDKTLVKKFVVDYLRGDGVFIVKMLDNNCGPVITADIVRQLWYLYRIRPSPCSADETTQF